MKQIHFYSAFILGTFLNIALWSLVFGESSQTYTEQRVKTILATHLYYLGISYNELGNQAEAKKFFQAALKLDPQSEFRVPERPEASYFQLDGQEIRICPHKEYDLMLPIKRIVKRGFFSAKRHEFLNQLPEAIQVMETVLKIDPANQEARTYLNHLYEKAGILKQQSSAMTIIYPSVSETVMGSYH